LQVHADTELLRADEYELEWQYEREPPLQYVPAGHAAQGDPEYPPLHTHWDDDVEPAGESEFASHDVHSVDASASA